MHTLFSLSFCRLAADGELPFSVLLLVGIPVICVIAWFVLRLIRRER